MAYRFASILGALCLVACGPTVEPDEAEPANNVVAAATLQNDTLDVDQPAADDRPIGARRRTLPIDEVDARDLIESLGAPWRGGLLDDAQYDSHSGGYRRSVMSSGGSAHIHTLADGKVWNLQIRSGMGDRCGQARDIAPHIAEIYSRLQPGKQLDREALANLIAGLDQSGAQQITIDGVRLSTVGNCMRSLDVRTTLEGE